MKLSMRMDGLKALDEQLARLQAELAGKVLARAARKAFAPVLEDAKAHAPVDTGLMRDSLRLVVLRPEDGDVAVQVGLRIRERKGIDKAEVRAEARKAAKAATKEAFGAESGAPEVARVKMRVTATNARRSAHWRWHFVEFGTAGMAAHPFLRPALHKNEKAVRETFMVELRKAIKSALKRQARKAAA